jgi:hypothetical protein
MHTNVQMHSSGRHHVCSLKWVSHFRTQHKTPASSKHSKIWVTFVNQQYKMNIIHHLNGQNNSVLLCC